MATVDEETSEDVIANGCPTKIKIQRVRGRFKNGTRRSVKARVGELSDPLLNDGLAEVTEESALDTDSPDRNDSCARDVEPLLEKIHGIVKKLDSKEQARYEDLCSKFSGIEENMSKALQLWSCGSESPIGAVGDGCFTASKARLANEGPGCEVEESSRSGAGLAISPPSKQSLSNLPKTVGKEDAAHNGTLWVKVSVQEPGETAWRCPKEMTTVAETGLVRSMTSTSLLDPSRQACPAKIQVSLMHARDLKNSDTLGKSDPYCVCAIGTGRAIHEQFHTQVVNETLDPGWNESHIFQKTRVGDTLHFSVKDKDIHSNSDDRDEVLGVCSLSYDQFYPGGFFGALQLRDEIGGKCHFELDDAHNGEDAPSKNVLRVLAQWKKDTESGDVSRNATSSKSLVVAGPHKDTTLDIVVAVIIVLNAIMIGISMDHDYGAFAYIDVCFTLCFIVEMIMKFKILTVRGYFASPFNWLDFGIIIGDIVQLILARFIKSPLTDDTPPAALFRMVRLVRLMRLLRLVNLDFLEDLIAMISGIMGGASTLLWAIVVFIVVIYITSVLFREFFGRRAHIMTCEECGDVDMTEYFDSVPRSMLTVFRFFFGDFSTVQGVNLYEGIQGAYGTVAEGFVCLVFFVVSIGVFNVITAIFVESTLQAAQRLESSKQVARLNDPDLWGENLDLLIRKLFEKSAKLLNLKDDEDLFLRVKEHAEDEIFESEFDAWIRDKNVLQALEKLEIDGADHRYLFDILDSDNTGSICAIELIDGLRRLRGNPRRSDIITIDLMVREIQEQTHLIVETLESLNSLKEIP